MSGKNKSHQIHISRIYDAPVRAVWDAWTDPEQVAQWWGPRGFSLTTHSKELKPGGHWNYTMHGPDGVDYPNQTKYFEVEQEKKLVYDHGASEDRPPLFRVTVLFFEEHGRTRMEMTMSLATPEAAEETKKFIKKAGGNATWDRLSEYLDKELRGKEKFVINRTFDCSIETMYRLWTDPKHFSQWLPPTGMEMQFFRIDARPGGHGYYKMSGNGFTLYGKIHYQKLEQPHRVVYTQEFCDEHENPSKHPLAPTWPATMLTIVDLIEEAPDRTRVTVTWEPVGDVTPEELEAFVKARAGMTMGWTGSFDKLEACVEKFPGE